MSATPHDTWRERVDALWAEADAIGDEALLAGMTELAAEHPDDPEALAELGGAHDSTGHPVEAAALYRRAVDAGLAEPELSRVTIQHASTLRNLGQHDASIQMLRDHFGAQPDHELASAASVFIALALATNGREREAVAELMRTIEPTLPRYNRSVAAYADALEAGDI
ncbi:tetratricopeptide repeat protein [Aeromicrobium sp. CF3.5]|uniref:tetratricopeptide repeat protein n=1 Tax=Aeromicrobium sp. CF3.5 TaxID=3373078 RepID=UPI003EE48FA5